MLYLYMSIVGLAGMHDENTNSTLTSEMRNNMYDRLAYCIDDMYLLEKIVMKTHLTSRRE